METVGFIGLGNMGGPVAGHIVSAGFPMVVFDLREEVTRPFEERGAKVADSVSDLARRSDVILTALPMPKDVEQVACGAAGIVEGIRPGAIYIDISTNPPSLIRKLAPLFQQKGAHVLDAPVASGQPGAARGIHEVMVGGEKNIFVGRMHVLHVQVPQTVFPNNYATDTFPLKLLRKDVGLATSLGRELNVPLPLANIAEQCLIAAVNRGLGDQSAYTVTFQLQEEAAQVELRADGIDPQQAGKYISTNPETA